MSQNIPATEALHKGVLEVLRELCPAALGSHLGSHTEPGTGDARLFPLPPEDTALSALFTDSMMVLSALISLEEKLSGDLGNLDPSAPPPQTLGDFIRLGASLNPDLNPDPATRQPETSTR